MRPFVWLFELIFRQNSVKLALDAWCVESMLIGVKIRLFLRNSVRLRWLEVGLRSDEGVFVFFCV